MLPLHPSACARRCASATTVACAVACALVVPTAARAQAVPADSARRDTAALPRVVVRGRQVSQAPRYGARRITSATRTDTPLRDTPQAVTVLGRELIADQAMQGMADVVRYVPGITMGQGEGHRDAPTIRGQSSTADFFVDGVRDDAQYLRDVYNLERVEALKGANAMTFGRGGGGGVLNRVTKEAGWSPLRTVAVEWGSFEHRRATVDVGGALDGLAAGRLNALAERSGSFRDRVGLERRGVNPTAAVLVGGTLVRAGYEYFDDERTVDRGLPSFAGRPFGAAPSTFFGDPGASRSTVAVHAGSATVERGASEGLLFRNRTRVASYDKFYQNVFAGGAVNAAGTRVNLSAYNNATVRHNAFNQTDVTWAVGSRVRHTLLAGVEVGRQHTDNVRRTGYFDDSLTAYPVDPARPTRRTPVSFRQSATDADARATAEVAGAYVQDQVSFGRFVQAIVGLRRDRFALAYRNDRTGERLRRVDGMLSPRAGLVLKPAEAVSVYGTYSVSHLPASGDQFQALTVTTSTLRPERFTNREAGVKWEPNAAVALSGAAYRIDRTNTTAPHPTEAGRVVQTGRQRTTGYELGVTGAVADWWQVAGGWASQRATILSRTSAAAAGKTVPLVPRTTLSLWNRLSLPRGLGAGIGVVHQTEMYAAIDNAVTLPGFTRLDGAAYLPIAAGVRAQLNVENLLGREYFATSHGNNNILPGAPRTVRVGISVAP